MRSRTRRLVLLATLLLAACGKDPPARVRGPVGTWVLDVEALKSSFARMIQGEVEAMVSRGEVEREDASRKRAQLLGEVSSLLETRDATFTLAADGTFTGDGSDGSMGGRWSVEGSRIQMTIDQERGEFVKHPDVWPGTWDAEAIVLKPQADKDYEMTLRHPPARTP